MMEPMLLIGAGPTGLAVGKALLEAGVDVVHVEATDHVGGNWAHGVYTTAHIISSKRTTEFADYPMPEDYPDFPSAEQMRVYFNRYADRFGLRDKIRFDTKVSRVEPDGVEGRDGWLVWFEGKGAPERFRGVIVCNGHHWEKSWPAWAKGLVGPDVGMRSGTTTHRNQGGSQTVVRSVAVEASDVGEGLSADVLRHSKDFKHPDELRDRRVLVVGGGNSGSDLICEAARVATRADWSLRRGYWFMPKTVLGMPTIELIKGWLPVAAQRLVMKTLLSVVVGPYKTYGLPKPDHDLFEAHPTVSTEVFHYLKHGRIHPRADVSSAARMADGKVGVRFVDGSESVYDLIVCATGFEVSFPFLPEGMVPIRGKVAEVWAGMLRPEWRHLWVVGTSQPRYGIGPLLRPLAQLIAEWVPLQDGVEVPLGAVLKSIGVAPHKTHLVDPHQALRMLAVARRLTPILKWRGRAMAARAGGASGSRGLERAS